MPYRDQRPDGPAGGLEGVGGEKLPKVNKPAISFFLLLQNCFVFNDIFFNIVIASSEASPRSYEFPANASHDWFPGHMHKGLRSMQRKMGDVDCVLEVARLQVSSLPTPSRYMTPEYPSVVGTSHSGTW